MLKATKTNWQQIPDEQQIVQNEREREPQQSNNNNNNNNRKQVMQETNLQTYAFYMWYECIYATDTHTHPHNNNHCRVHSALTSSSCI